MSHWFINKLKQYCGRTALIHGERQYLYDDLLKNIAKKKDWLKGKVSEGEVVAIVSDYNFESISLFLSLLELRCIITPIARTQKNEVTEKSEESFIEKIIFIENNTLSLNKSTQNTEEHKIIQELRAVNDAGLILFSSGSTGKPKAMVHNLNNLCETHRLKRPKSLNIMVFLMFDHIGGLNTLIGGLSMGVQLIIPENRTPDTVCKAIEEFKVNILPSSPTFLNLILMSGAHNHYDLGSLKLITYGTEPMPESLLLRLREIFPRVKLLQTFGTSETGIAQTTSQSSSSTFIKFNDPCMEYKIISSELWLRSTTQIMGYLNAPMDKFTHDGWFKTGDIVEQAPDGFLRIIGRASEIINVGGEKVFPGEVESVLLQIPEVKDCIVFGESNSITGQSVTAQVVVESKVPTKEAKRKIRTFCRNKLDPYKVPARIVFSDETKINYRFKKSR